jgi:hypothetical protein
MWRGLAACAIAAQVVTMRYATVSDRSSQMAGQEAEPTESLRLIGRSRQRRRRQSSSPNGAALREAGVEESLLPGGDARIVASVLETIRAA